MGKYRKASALETFTTERRRRRNWKSVVAALSCLVAAGTVGALTLPAITMTKPACQLEEHQHGPECYAQTRALTCNAESLNIHQHTEGCFDEEGNVICPLADFIIHEHDDLCFDADGNLVCTLPEIKEHQHDETCYTPGEEKITDPGHKHSDECYQWNQSETLICNQEETAGHTHTDECRDENGEPICQQEESEAHQHTEECYEQIKGDLLCEEPERDPVTESGAPILTCEKPEIEAHIHDEGCYEEDEETQQKTLICPLTEIRTHQHTEECFTTEQVLICGKTEHSHTPACVADKTADVETASDWEAALPKHTGVWADDVVAVAQSQIGYQESAANFQLAEDNETRKGYTRYGEWAGNPYGDWDAMFAAFCLHYAGISQEVFPSASGANAWAIALKDLDLYTDAAGYTPSAGDLVFFDEDGDGRADSLGILEKLDTPAEADALPTLQVIRGDWAETEAPDTVCRVAYPLGDTSILGFGPLPAQQLKESPGSLTWEGDGCGVTVAWNENPRLPGNAELRVQEYDRASEEWLAQYARAMEMAGWTEKTAPEGTEPTPTAPETAETAPLQDFRLFHIGLYAGEEALTPAAPMNVTLSMKGDGELPCRLMNFAGDGAEVNAEAAFAEGLRTVCFEAELPGVYGLLLGEQNAAPTTLTHQGEYYNITVTYGPEAKLPEGTQLTVSEYDEESDTLMERYLQAAELYGWDMEQFHPFQLFDISLTAEGEAVQPAAPVEVTVSFFDMEERTEYAVTHYGEGTAEELASVSDFAEGTQTVRFTASGFSDYSVSAVEAEGISLAAAGPTPIPPVDGYTDKKGDHNTWKNISQNVLDSCTKLTFGGTRSGNNKNITTPPSGYDEKVDGKVNKVYPYVVKLEPEQFSTLDSGGTVTLTDQGYIKIQNTGTVDGKSVDTIVTFDKVTFYGCFKQAHLAAYPAKGDLKAAVVAPKNSKICVAAIKNTNELWLGMNYCNDLGARERYNNTYTYPCNETLDVTIKIVEHGTNTLMNTQFLQVASDIDVWRNGSPWEYKNEAGTINDTYRGRYAETVTTLDGFNSTFYCYPGNWNNITENAAGRISVAATPKTVTNDGAAASDGDPHSGGVGGTNSYTLTGIYGETQSSTWKMRYTEGWCSTEVEIYIPSWPVTIQKVDKDEHTNALSGAKFILSRVENGATLFRTSDNTWNQNRTRAAQYVTADKTGKVQINDLHPGDYILTEVEAPPGYYCLGDIHFNLSVGGVLTTNNDMVIVDPETNSLLLTVQNKAGQRLPETGGMGTILYTFSGMALICAAALVYSKQRRKRKGVR